jgi:hypothetical protein
MNTRTIVQRFRATPLRAQAEHQDQRLDQRPQLIRHQPQRRTINHSPTIIPEEPVITT